MSTLSKIFVVLNFVLAVAFMVTTLTLYAKKSNWVEESRKNVELRNALKYQLDKLKGKYDGDVAHLNTILEGARKDAKDKGSRLTEETAEKGKWQGQAEGLRSDLTKQAADINALGAKFATLDEANKRLQDESTAMRAERDKAVAAREFAETQSIETVADLKEAEAELMQLAKKNAGLVEDVLQKDYMIEQARKRGYDVRSGAAAAAKFVPGKVLQVEEAVNIVILNVGEKDEVKPGMEFVISRGDKYVGKVRVRNIYRDMCSATILPEMTKEALQVGDTAQTL